MTADIDFRSPTELEAAADRVPHTATYHHEPVFDTDRTESSKTNAELEPLLAVSYTHLDVYKRQMYYAPQAWCSDDTDAVERIYIQDGTSYGYIPSMWGAHVSAVPNDQVGRVTSLDLSLIHI